MITLSDINLTTLLVLNSTLLNRNSLDLTFLTLVHFSSLTPKTCSFRPSPGKPEAVVSCSVASSSPSETKTVTLEVRCVAKADGDLSKIFHLKVKRKGQHKAEKGQHHQMKPVFVIKG